MAGCRAEAETLAFECCVVEWVNRNPESCPPGRCRGCGGRDFSQDPLLPYGIESTGHTWLHSRCWPAWYETRKARASAALSRMGITVPVDHDMGSEHNVPIQTKRRSSVVGERGQEEKA